MINFRERLNSFHGPVTEDYLREIGQQLKKWRTLRGLSLRDLAFLTDIDNSKIAKIEKGEINITIIIFKRLLVGLEVTEQAFFNPPVKDFESS